ncbi:MAG: ATP-dependent helicase [Corynebacterium sp.]|uniref:UvrD-helicase domain-containing protein n=1 Tax=Corynebacterium sp. TaxID=1720 RepID=UPI0026470581|nr:ATP-dependent helicase [Corynebacterium sp.]MDN5722127.1 ATP-dependent helicase [Corynebacterium sp.]MDN6281916.1 ATP-dependent helicase [Corynebacterium sp.]MDN6305688.1 ATP-dependent helicase [Corynebacterium sp.]MDN6352174.1 ATP-dependent helicase [Corynebacterium sp.]MDN6366936.1 ATP-dependent helicase [Corynebacterium sp.]
MNGFVLSEEQCAAATSEKDHLLIVAPPGCGKTEVLAHRAAYQIGSLQPNQRVLALTFTKRARANLEERLRSVLGRARARRQIVVRNFHGFAAQVVLAHGRTIGLRMDDLGMPKTSTIRKAMQEAGGGGDTMYDAERLLSEIKREPLSDAEVLEAIQQRHFGAYAVLAEKVERARQGANQLHYDDLLRHAQRLLRVPAVARLYQAHFGAVLVDEFQDLSLQQLDVAILSCTERRTFAGDPLQGIYSWAGAAPAEVEAEVRRTCGDPIRLHESYRSSPMVLDTVNSISEQADPESGLVSALPDEWLGGGCSAALVLEDQAAEAELVVRLATAIHGAVPEASIGIIARAGWRRKTIDAAFAYQTGVPVRRWELAIDDPATVALIQSTVATLPRGATVADARIAVLESLDPADVDVKEIIDDAFGTLEQSEATTARAAVRSIRTADPKQAVGPGVHLLNAHTGKGQQFDWTFVVGLEEGHLPGRRNSHGDALDEEQRVLLVMLSRARHGLIVTRTRKSEGRYGPRFVAESRWWSAIKARYSSEEEIRSHIEEHLLP